jgi:signal peptidase I
MRWVLFLGAAAVAACAVIILRGRFVAIRVDGESMEPGLHPGDRVLVRRVPLHGVRRGQVVVFAPPAGLSSASQDPPWLVKRVAALPGDAVPPALREREVVGDARVPPDRFVALGDNAARSYDSRRAGYFHAETLLGVVVRKLR